MDSQRTILLLSVLHIIFFPAHVSTQSSAILHLLSDYISADACVSYNPDYSPLPRERKNALFTDLVQASPKHGCQAPVDEARYNAATVLVFPGGNCTFFEKLQIADKYHARQVVLISNNRKDFPRGTTEQHKSVRVSVARMTSTNWFKLLRQLGMPHASQLYSPPEPAFDPNLVLLWLIPIFVVVTGAYWYGYEQKRPSQTTYGTMETSSDSEGSSKTRFSALIIVAFVLMICCTLLLLYYFYKYLVYVVIAVFAIATAQGTFDCFSAISSVFECTHRKIPENDIPLLRFQPRISDIFLYILCCGISAFWVVIRNDQNAWILQDFLGVCLCISILRNFAMPNLKYSAMLLIALLVYDIFFVFITPFFSAQGESIMVQVALGEGTKESIPMVLRVPKLIPTGLSLCEMPFSLVGLGDILVPGIFVSFCHAFDVASKTKYPIYFITSSVAYGVGLFLAYLVLVLMKSGQPALLYLCPCVLLSVSIVGLCRGEFKELCRGELDMDKRSLFAEHNDADGDE